MKKRVAFLSLWVLVISTLAVAADLSGTWILDKSKSDPIRMGGRRGGDPGAAPPADISITLEIKQTTGEVVIKRLVTGGGNERPPVEQKFTLDGKENKNPAGMGRGEFTAKAKWESGKLAVDGKQMMQTPNGDMEMILKDEYAVSDDGKILTYTSTRTGRQGEPRTTKQVFNKQ
jgi:hypothetical protein